MGGLKVVIVDQTGAVVSGAHITLFSAEKVREVRADEAGATEFSELPAGTYDLEVSQPGFKLQTTEDIQVSEGKLRQLEITLQVKSTGSDCGVSRPSVAYEKKSGDVKLIGKIVGSLHGPVNGAFLKLTSSKSGREVSATSAVDGSFQFSHLEHGKYKLMATKKGYSDVPAFSFWITRENLTRIALYTWSADDTEIIICE